MPEMFAGAAQRGLSAGTLLIASGGLALYLMTSLAIGPAGSRELHLSLAIPSVDAEDISGAQEPSADHVMGRAMVLTAAPSVTAVPQGIRRPASPQTSNPQSAPTVISPTAGPVASVPTPAHRKGHPQSPKRHEND